MEFRMLGPVEAWAAGERVDLGGPKILCLLAALLVEPGKPVGVDTLIHRVWDDERPVRGTLHRYVSQLRRTLERADPRLARAIPENNRGFYRLDVEATQVDWHRFLRFEHEAQKSDEDGDLDRALHLRRSSLEEWRSGQALGNVTGVWAEGMRRDLDTRRVTVATACVETLLAMGRHDRALDEVGELLRDRSDDQRLVGLRMIAFDHTGRRSDAISYYHQVRARLGDCGLEPAPQLQTFFEHLLQPRSPLLPLPRMAGRRMPRRAACGDSDADDRRTTNRSEPVPGRGTINFDGWTYIQGDVINGDKKITPESTD